MNKYQTRPGYKFSTRGLLSMARTYQTMHNCSFVEALRFVLRHTKKS